MKSKLLLGLVFAPFLLMLLSEVHAGQGRRGSRTGSMTGRNLPPVCVIPPNIVVERMGDQTVIILDGSGSFDPEGNRLRYGWATSCPGATIANFDAPVTELILDTPEGEEFQCGARLTVFDGALRTLCSFTITITAPEPDPGVCLVIIDEDTIDNGISTIEQAAASLNVTSDYLVNDDMPTEGANPPLRWNDLAPGMHVLLPGGSVDDEGLFALPPDAPFDVLAYGAGTVPQSQLDPIPDVMPLRNHEIYDLIGLTCTAVVYDSDISMNFHPIQGNLQGARYGLFTFTLLDVVVPGSIPESQSSTSLYDLYVRVEEFQSPTFGYEVTIRDHEPDSIQITTADWSNDVLTIRGTSNFAPGARMTVSVEDFVTEVEMTFNNGQYEIEIPSRASLDGRRVTISTDAGGAYNDFIN